MPPRDAPDFAIPPFLQSFVVTSPLPLTHPHHLPSPSHNPVQSHPIPCGTGSSSISSSGTSDDHCLYVARRKIKRGHWIQLRGSPSQRGCHFAAPSPAVTSPRTAGAGAGRRGRGFLAGVGGARMLCGCGCGLCLRPGWCTVRRDDEGVVEADPSFHVRVQQVTSSSQLLRLEMETSSDMTAHISVFYVSIGSMHVDYCFPWTQRVSWSSSTVRTCVFLL